MLETFRACEPLTPEQFSEKAAHVLSELNYVHAFREGNGRANEALVVSLGAPMGMTSI
ncbi:Fic family protein [Rhizobium sp. FKY42]|uniref:Fic family protein n=1 Tax=Rhizobium sp. FKY42 TaxID=2562310 RepID=UPI0032B2F6EE